MSSLSISNLSAAYGQVRVIEDLSMNVQSGETVALLGTNGNGKSTLMRALSGLGRPVEGDIRFVGEAIESIANDGLRELAVQHAGHLAR